MWDKTRRNLRAIILPYRFIVFDAHPHAALRELGRPDEAYRPPLVEPFFARLYFATRPDGDVHLRSTLLRTLLLLVRETPNLMPLLVCKDSV